MAEDVLELLAMARSAARDNEGRNLRRAAGLSLREAAFLIGCAPNSLRAWEDGRARPTGVRATAYGRLLGWLVAFTREATA